MSKGVRTSTIEKLKSGQTVSLYSHYYGAWDAEEKRFLVYYKDYTYPTMPQKLIGIVQVSVDTDGIPVLDTKRLPIANNSLIPMIKKYVFAIFGIAIESTKADEDIVKLEGTWAIKPSQLRALKGATIHGKQIKGIIIEEIDDGTTQYLVRTQDGIETLKDVFHTTTIIFLED